MHRFAPLGTHAFGQHVHRSKDSGPTPDQAAAARTREQQAFDRERATAAERSGVGTKITGYTGFVNETSAPISIEIGSGELATVRTFYPGVRSFGGITPEVAQKALAAGLTGLRDE